MVKKILIIEDNEPDYKKVTSILDRYEIDYYPKRNDFFEFSRLLVLFAVHNNDRLLKDIRKSISNFKPDFVILDRCLNDTNKYDETGLIIKKEILDELFPNVKVCILTNASTPSKKYGSSGSLYIEKGSRIGLDAEIYKKILEPLGVNLRIKDENKKDRLSSNTLARATVNEKLNDGSKSSFLETDLLAAESNLDIPEDYSEYVPENPLKLQMELPKNLSRFAIFFDYKLFPWFQLATDLFITIIFFALFSYQIGVGGFHLYLLTTFANFDPLIAAEYAFVYFLPALIIFGFFVFYVHALRPYVNKTPITIIDFESPSKLMKITKKLFISSLISYLFTNIIQITIEQFSHKEFIISLQNPTGITFLVHIGIMVGLIIILICFYIYLNNHEDADHNDNSEKNPYANIK